MTKVFLPPEQAWTFSRLPQLLNDLGIEPTEVLHVGANVGQEIPIYRLIGFPKIRVVEPDPGSVAEIKRKYVEGFRDVEVIEAACATSPLETGTGTLYRGNRSDQYSLIPNGGEEITVPTVFLLDIQGNEAVLVIDVQGLELDIAKTADLTRDTLKMVIIESSTNENDSASPYEAVVAYMTGRGWKLVESWVHDSSPYWDNCFVRA